MGKMQRTKGYRVERELVLKLKAEGHEEVRRVPLSGASAFAKHDVLVGELSIEVKGRKNAFGSMYKLHQDLAQQSIMYKDQFVVISDDFNDMVKTEFSFRPLSEVKLKAHKRALNRFTYLRKICDGADVLALKDNHKRFLFMRFF